AAGEVPGTDGACNAVVDQVRRWRLLAHQHLKDDLLPLVDIGYRTAGYRGHHGEGHALAVAGIQHYNRIRRCYRLSVAKRCALFVVDVDDDVFRTLGAEVVDQRQGERADPARDLNRPISQEAGFALLDVIAVNRRGAAVLGRVRRSDNPVCAGRLYAPWRSNGQRIGGVGSDYLSAVVGLDTLAYPLARCPGCGAISQR